MEDGIGGILWPRVVAVVVVVVGHHFNSHAIGQSLVMWLQ